MDIAINYMFLGRAIGHYSRLGYHYIEAPWLVSEQASDITRPPEAPQLSLPLLGGALVASAEQSFLQLDLDNRLPEGRFVACTPCFRPEPVPDRYRQTTFMKVELYQNVDVSEESMFMMLADAQDFMTLMTFEHTPPWKGQLPLPEGRGLEEKMLTTSDQPGRKAID